MDVYVKHNQKTMTCYVVIVRHGYNYGVSIILAKSTHPILYPYATVQHVYYSNLVLMYLAFGSIVFSCYIAIMFDMKAGYI